ncbi:MAG: Rrf2 family transcriptional regulator [Candidatus Symbiobacter sp.]|nr:Rrf2 family transcriptional regulator [Candidatus Symbiobacter sp.]
MTLPASIISLPSRAFIAIEIVLDIAWHSGGRLVSSNDITRRAGIARRSLEPILQELTRAQILAGVRGPHGGYRLARERRNITIGMIFQALQHEPAPPSSDGEKHLGGGSASSLSQKVIAPLWHDISQKIWQELSPLTVEHLCQRADAAKIPSQGRIAADFDI